MNVASLIEELDEFLVSHPDAGVGFFDAPEGVQEGQGQGERFRPIVAVEVAGTEVLLVLPKVTDTSVGLVARDLSNALKSLPDACLNQDVEATEGLTQVGEYGVRIDLPIHTTGAIDDLDYFLLVHFRKPQKHKKVSFWRALWGA